MRFNNDQKAALQAYISALIVASLLAARSGLVANWFSVLVLAVILPLFSGLVAIISAGLTALITKLYNPHPSLRGYGMLVAILGGTLFVAAITALPVLAIV